LAGSLESMKESSHSAWGYGVVTADQTSKVVLDTWFPDPRLGSPPKNFDPYLVPRTLSKILGPNKLTGVLKSGVTTVINLDEKPLSTSDAYLRLHLLSHRLAMPNEINLEGIFDLLPVVAFTNRGPTAKEYYDRNRSSLLDAGAMIVCLDRFPPMLNYVTPSGIRIADASRVRLGAYLAAGTTVMHEGFINFNAGTLGPSMIEGRVSQGVIVGEGTDVGGGASIMGTLSGGGREVISIGKRCLLGANSGVGISLGDNCIVEAGLYLTAGAKVSLIKEESVERLKAVDLSGKDNLLFRRNSQTGTIEALQQATDETKLNPDLHS